MSFIDYNFFPILFFLGWNILTTKQFRPIIDSTSDSKTSSTLSVFSLKSPLSQVKRRPITNSINQRILQSHLKHKRKRLRQKTDILEFIPEFKFLSKNKKLIDIPRANSICSENQTNDASVLKNTLLKHKIPTIYTKEGFLINCIAKPTKLLINENKTHHFTNYNLINNNWKKNFKGSRTSLGAKKVNIFDFTYRSKRKTLFSGGAISFFFYNKIKPLFSRMESSISLASPFYISRPCGMETHIRGPEGCVEKGSTPAFFFASKAPPENYNWFQNDIYLKGLCFSQSNISFYKKIQNQVRRNWFFNKIAYPRVTAFLNSAPTRGLKNLPQGQKNPSILQGLKFGTSSTKKTIKNNDCNEYNMVLRDSSFLWIKATTRKLNAINSIQKRRLKIRLSLRVPNQKIYSLSQFQIALCFSKILKPPIFFNENYRLNPTSSFLARTTFENERHSQLQERNQFKTSVNTESPELDHYIFNPVKNKLESQTISPKAEIYFREIQPFLSNPSKMDKDSNGLISAQYLDNSFLKPHQEIGYVDNYKMRKKSWYMKTQFFQHIAWNMKHNIFDRFSSLEYLLRQTNLSPPFNKIPGHTDDSIIINRDTARDSVYQNKHYFSEEQKKILPLRGGYRVCQNYFLRIYTGSWYYENLVFPYSLFNTTDKTSSRGKYLSPLRNSTNKGFIKAEIKPLLSNLSKMDKDSNGLISALEGDITVDPDNHLNNSLNYKEDSFFTKSHTRLESDIGIYSLAHKLSSVGFRNGNSEINIYPFKYNDSYRYNFQNMNLSNQRLKNFTQGRNLPQGFFAGRDLIRERPHRETTNIEQNFTTDKRTHLYNFKKFLDFQNPIFSKIYAPIFQPQGLNLLSFITKSFLNVIPNSILNVESMAFFDSSRQMKKTPLSNKIGGLFSAYQTQPKILTPHDFGLPFNEFINRSKTSFSSSEDLTKKSKIRKQKETISAGADFRRGADPTGVKFPTRAEPLPPAGANNSVNESFQNTPRPSGGFKMLNALYHKLPINGIHSNLYPWITQNSFDRWSTSSSLWTLSNSSFYSPPVKNFKDRLLRFFSETQSDNLQTNTVFNKKFVPTSSLNDSYKTPFFSVSRGDRPGILSPHINKIAGGENKFKNTNLAVLKTSVNKEFPQVSQKISLQEPKNPVTAFASVEESDSQLHFTEKPSCIKKPSIFFSSFRYLPYFFISETLSKKNVIFPQANLCPFSMVNSSNYQLEKKRPPRETKNVSNHLSIPPAGANDLFDNNIFRPGLENEKKNIVKDLCSLQHKSFSLKPLSTFVKKEVGYQTSLFSWAPQISSTTNMKVNQWPNNSVGHRKNLMVPKEKSIQKIDLLPIQKTTWKVFPPLFQPLTFRFIDLNLPRTWSSELLTPLLQKGKMSSINTPIGAEFKFSNKFKNPSILFIRGGKKIRPGEGSYSNVSLGVKQQTESDILPQNAKWNITQKNFFRFSIPFYFSDFFHFPVSETPHRGEFDTKSNSGRADKENTEFYESAFPLTNSTSTHELKQSWNTNSRKGVFEKKSKGSMLSETPKFQNSKIVVYGDKPLLKNRTVHGPPLKNQKESISLPSYLKNITNQNYQNLCPNNLNELYFVFWILFNKTLFIYLSLHYLRKFISFLGTEYIRNLFKIFVTMKFIDGNVLSIIKTFQDFNFQLNQQNVIDIKVDKQLKEIKRN